MTNGFNDPTPPAGVPAPPPDSLPTQQMPVTGASFGAPPPTPPPAQPSAFNDPNRPIWLVVAVGVLLVVLLIVGIIVLANDGDDDGDVITGDPTSSLPETSEPIVSNPTDTTIVDTTTTIAPETTVVETTTTVDTTTTTTIPPTTTTTIPPTTTTTVAPAPTTQPVPVVTVPPAPEATVWDVVVNSPDLSQFRAFVEEADLIDLFDGPEPVTVFVPSNDAFDLFLSGIGNQELTPDDLAALLRRHVVNGALSSADVFGRTELEPLEGQPLAVDGAARTIDGANFVVVDVRVAGGVIHVIDRVLPAPTTEV